MTNPWLTQRRIPVAVSAVLAALDLRAPALEPLTNLNAEEWQQALRFCDRSQLTLAVRRRARDRMPEAIRDRVDADSLKNRQRTRRLIDELMAAARRLSEHGIPFLLLKGLAQSALSGTDPAERVQYDIDLFCPREHVTRACDALRDGGYEPLRSLESFPTDHLPALIRKTGWEWRGDFFDPDIPASVELHYRFWDAETERLRAPGADQFWERHTSTAFAGISLPVLGEVDAVAYSALHMLRHLLRGSLHAWHVYELAMMLEQRVRDELFWTRRLEWHAPELRRLQTVSFALAQKWFGCNLHDSVQQEIAELPAGAAQWLADWFAAPVLGVFEPNKNELWLHLSLLDSAADRWRVARRRVLPARLPGPVDAVYLPDGRMTARRRIVAGARNAVFAASRALHHVRVLPGLAGCGLRFTARQNGLTEAYWRFLACAGLYNLGLYVFVLLYNIYLLELGLKEDVLGAISGAMTAGCVAGTVPAGVLARRFGLRNTLLVCSGTTAAIAAARAGVSSPTLLIALAFGSGLAFSIWAVCMAPTVSAAVEAKHRPAAFSLFFACMIGLGVAGGAIGGYLPGWVHGTRPALLAAAVLAGLAAWPARGLVRSKVAGGGRTYPRGPFITRFLAVFALWHLATGSFNPFFNAYFAHLGMHVSKIGLVFSASQLIQVAAVLAAPILMRAVGVPRALSLMMLGTAAALAGLSAAGAASAAILYAGYMGVQWMSEPGFNVLLMNRVTDDERSGAAALANLIAFSMQAVAAVAAGGLLAGSGYRVLLLSAAVVGAIAAFAFGRLIGRNERGSPSPPEHSAGVPGTIPG